jgi:hypothetical protein
MASLLALPHVMRVLPSCQLIRHQVPCQHRGRVITGLVTLRREQAYRRIHWTLGMDWPVVCHADLLLCFAERPISNKLHAPAARDSPCSAAGMLSSPFGPCIPSRATKVPDSPRVDPRDQARRLPPDRSARRLTHAAMDPQWPRLERTLTEENPVKLRCWTWEIICQCMYSIVASLAASLACSSAISVRRATESEFSPTTRDRRSSLSFWSRCTGGTVALTSLFERAEH